ncbi:MAG: RraA family protein [Candidatus Latescibacteria bacterium]|nr:RraA family protein [Candidatus Latescibacterota bacterium]
MAEWRDDAGLFELMRRELFSAVVGDVMDEVGLVRQFLPPEIQPLRDDMVVAGRAMPVLEADWTERDGGLKGDEGPFGLMFEAVDDLGRNEVYVCTGASPTYALWGELMSTRAMKLGASGAVLDGFSRDARGILELNFPTFCAGRYAQDQRVRGRVVDYRCTLTLSNGAGVSPGDIVFGDLDGVVIVPAAAVTDVINRALDKVRGENRVREAIENGMSAREAFERYGIM